MSVNLPVVIVTGASRGLGLAVARLAAQMGAAVVLAARSLDRLQAEAQAIAARGGTALAVQADVSREDDCRALIRQAVDRYGRLDALVNNSGTVEPIGPIAGADRLAWEQNWAVNLLGPVLLAQSALPYLRETSGKVVNISSGAAETIVGGWGAYSTSKVALDHFTRILASEEPAITALALRPGIVDTEMQATIREKGKARMAERNYRFLSGLHEQRRLLSPEQPGRAIACLALHAPHEWSGRVLAWDDELVRTLVSSSCAGA